MQTAQMTGFICAVYDLAYCVVAVVFLGRFILLLRDFYTTAALNLRKNIAVWAPTKGYEVSLKYEIGVSDFNT